MQGFSGILCELPSLHSTQSTAGINGTMVDRKELEANSPAESVFYNVS